MNEADELLARFGKAVGLFLARAGKAKHTSGMFDMRRRTLLGVYAYFDHLQWALDLLDARATPEQLGAAGRRLCGEPFSAQIHGVLWAQMLARENELGMGRDGGDPAHHERVIQWWARAAAAYRAGDDGALLPCEDGDRQPAAPAAEVLEAVEAHGRPPAELPQAARTTAALQLYSYVLRGEQRGTTYYHGPYPGEGGGSLIVEEFTRMRHNQLPWAGDPAPLPLDTYCSVLELDGVKTSFDLFQGMATDPPDYRSRILRTSLLTRDGGELRPVEKEEWEETIAVAGAEQERIFREQFGWSEDFRMSYAVYHYLDFLEPFFSAAGCGPEAIAEARVRFEQTVERRLREVAETEPVPVWERLFSRADDALFTPLEGAEATRG